MIRQQYEIPFNVEIVQIFPTDIGIQAILAAVVSLTPDIIYKPVRSTFALA